MTEFNDELEALRTAWRQIQVSDEERQRASEDPETRACMDWMANAWASLEAPAASPSRSEQAATDRPLRRGLLLHVLPFAAAACALFFWQVGHSTTGSDVDGAQSFEIAVVDPPDPVIHPLIHADGSIETRAGNVRLILLPEAASGAPDDAHSPEQQTATPRSEN